MMKGAFQAYLPAFLIAIGTFSLAFGLVMLWFFLAGR